MRGPQPWNTNRARVLRDQQTSAEQLLWSRLRARRLEGYKFVRQMPLSGCYVDFLCRDMKLVVEVDGATHSTADELMNDEKRTKMLEELGYRVVRVTNVAVYENIDGVCAHILSELESAKSAAS